MHTHRALNWLSCANPVLRGGITLLLINGCVGPVEREGRPAPQPVGGSAVFTFPKSDGPSQGPLPDVIEPHVDVHTEEDSGPESGGFDYECEILTVEACITSCGSIGERICAKSWGPCEPPPEICNGLDDDCDGVVDNGVVNACGVCGETPKEICNGFDDNCDGQVDEGLLNACGACGATPEETCNGFDDNCDGQVDEGLLNACGACGATPQEICNGIDDNCDGQIDEGVSNPCGGCQPLTEEIPCNGIDDDCDGSVDAFTYSMNFSGDCLFVECPPEAPYPVGCDLNFAGGDKRGCVASQPNISVLYLQEGDQCGAGSVSGSVTCSCQPGAPLNEGNCPINKPQKFYVTQPFQCPDTSD